jgi:riboflavin transporter FmnP
VTIKNYTAHHMDVRTLSASAVFAALSAMLTFVPSLSFPLLPYLVFQVAEIPIMICAFLYGPIPGVVSSFAYWLILNFVGQFQPIGPFMAFLAVISMVAGAWLGASLIKKLGLNSSLNYVVGLMLSFGVTIRIVLMSMLNYAILWILMPDFLKMAAGSLSATIGLKFQSNLDVLMVALVATAIFNLIQTLFSGISAYGIVRIVSYKRSFFRTKTSWISSAINDSSKVQSHQ